MININFDDTFELEEVSDDNSCMTFISPLKNGGQILLKVRLALLDDPQLPNVYNLCFGPLYGDGSVDDNARVNHQDVSRVFSTILLFCLNFLQENPGLLIGLDGSNDARAYLYHRMFVTNRDNLNRYFITSGVDWYVRLMRNGTVEVDENDEILIKPKPMNFDYGRNMNDLYRYYLFYLNPLFID